MSISNTQTYEMSQQGMGVNWLTRAISLAFGVITLVISTRFEDGRLMIRVLAILLIGCGLAMFARVETIVEPDMRIIRRQLYWLGQFAVSRTQYSFSDFTAVVVQRVHRSDCAKDSDQFFVSLRRHSGRLLLIRYFDADVAHQCRPAGELAHRLAADINIEIDSRET